MSKRIHPITAAWQAYWSDRKAPHPDSFALEQAPRPLGRALAPFANDPGETSLGRMDLRESWYCHHYRLPGEHYHKTMAELEGCER